MNSAQDILAETLGDIQSQLDQTVQYWLNHSIDEEHGGFYNCLTCDGQVYDSHKYGWLQGRQVWTLAKLYNDVERFKTVDVFNAAKHGSEFLQQCIKSRSSMRCSFCVTKSGDTVKVQRTIFTEAFYTIAMSEMFRITGDNSYLDAAVAMMDKIIYWAFTDGSELGLGLAADVQEQPLNVPLIVLGTLEQLYTADPALLEKYQEVSRQAAEKVLQHVIVQADGSKYVFEFVGVNGEKLDESNGNLLNPGHAIEAGWFLLEFIQRDPHCGISADQVINDFILGPMRYGWDEKFGGLFYFLDAREDVAPTQLEWHMKLWWPHNEAMIALLMAYEMTPSEQIMKLFQQVFNYSCEHFVDREHGEWYGYLDRQGEPTSKAKGAPFKGCFHVPRSLMMCEQLLTRTIAKQSQWSS